MGRSSPVAIRPCYRATAAKGIDKMVKKQHITTEMAAFLRSFASRPSSFDTPMRRRLVAGLSTSRQWSVRNYVA